MKLAVIGMGLMGGSAALAMRQAGVVDRVVACDLNPDEIQTSIELGIADEGTQDVLESVRGADVVMVATPVMTMEAIFRQAAPGLGDGAVITDVGSVRGAVQESASRALGKKFCRYAPCHPIAGGEKPGVRYANPGMFRGKNVISTSGLWADRDAVERMEGLWKACGANIIRMTAERHDEVFATMSHLPHVLSFAFVKMVTESRNPDELLRMGGTGFLDFSRIAASSPVMWRDICLTNREAISRGLRRYRRELERFQKDIDEGNADRLVAEFARAAQARRGLGPGPKGKK